MSTKLEEASGKNAALIQRLQDVQNTIKESLKREKEIKEEKLLTDSQLREAMLTIEKLKAQNSSLSRDHS